MNNPLPSSRQMAVNNEAGQLINNGQSAEALKTLDSLLRECPEYWAAHFNRGNALKEMKHWKEAIEAYDKALELAEKPPWLGILPMHIVSQIHNNRGGALLDWGMLDSAMQAFQAGLKADPTNRIAQVNLQNMPRFD